MPCRWRPQSSVSAEWVDPEVAELAQVAVLAVLGQRDLLEADGGLGRGPTAILRNRVDSMTA